VHRALVARLAAAGLEPVYRRYDPRLGEADVERHRVIVWLGGRIRGSRGSLAVTRAEVDRAVRFVRGGGRLVLGVMPIGGAAGAEARAFQAILDRLGIPIAIEPHDVVDLSPDGSYPAGLFRAPLFAPDPGHPAAAGLPPRIAGERSAALGVGPGATAALWTLPTAFLDRIYGPPPAEPAAFGRRAVVAEGSVAGDGGRVLVASRLLLDAGGAHLVASAEPLLPERLPAGALDGRERFLAQLLREFAGGSSPGRAAAAPAGTGTEARCGAWRPGEAWVEREGLRVGWGYVDRPEAELDALLARLPGSGLNALWGPADSWRGLAWPARSPAAAAAAEAWIRRVDAGLRGTPVRWLAGVNMPADATLAPYGKAVSIGGLEIALPSPVDLRFWDEQIVPQLLALAARAADVPLLAGVILDLEMYGRPVLYYGDAFDFGDAPFFAFLDDPLGGAALAAAERDAARRLPADARGDWLLETGRLPRYYAWLERRAEEVGRRLRAALDTAAPSGRDLVLGFYAAGILRSWFYQGLWRGASAGGRPVLLLTFEVDAGADLREAAAGGLCTRHATAALLGLVGQDGLAEVLARAGRRHDGFWLNRITTLVAPPGLYEEVEVPAGVSGDAAWAWIADAVKGYVEARRGRHETPAEGAR
jgi:hypothetical protein